MTAREPLPYEHARHEFDRGLPTACSLPETDSRLVLHATRHCSGCRAWAMAMTVQNPGDMVRDTRNGEVKLRLDVIRQITDDTDPMRVLFERALRERGIE